MKRRTATLVAGIASALSLGALAADMPPDGAFQWLYSSLCQQPNSGDAAGWRIRLSGPTERPSLSMEWAEGPVAGPETATRLTMDPATATLEFVLAGEGHPPYAVRGVWSAEAVVIRSWDWGDGQGGQPAGWRVPRVDRAVSPPPPCPSAPDPRPQ
jgi:hypothetical protein